MKYLLSDSEELLAWLPPSKAIKSLPLEQYAEVFNVPFNMINMRMHGGAWKQGVHYHFSETLRKLVLRIPAIIYWLSKHRTGGIAGFPINIGWGEDKIFKTNKEIKQLPLHEYWDELDISSYSLVNRILVGEWRFGKHISVYFSPRDAGKDYPFYVNLKAAESWAKKHNKIALDRGSARVLQNNY